MTPNLDTQQFIMRVVTLTLCSCLIISLTAMVGVVAFRDGISTSQLLQYLVEIVWGLISGLGVLVGAHIMRNPVAAVVTATAAAPAPEAPEAPVAPAAGE